METILTTSPFEAAALIKQGRLVAFPTETVYGLGANIFDEAAIAKIFIAKGRPQDNPLIAHIAHVDDLQELTSEVTESARKFAAAFFPGPLTIVLPRAPRVPSVATAGLNTIGVRMPHHPLAQEFLRACGVPVVAPSANLSGRPSPTTWQAVAEDLNGRIDAILCDEQTEVGLESTVVDCTGAVPLVLRSGAVTLEQLQGVVPETRLADADADKLKRSPGTQYQHYSPRAAVVLVEHPEPVVPGESAAYIGLEPTDEDSAYQLEQICLDVEEYAHELFAFFRRCDEAGIPTIYCQMVPETGLGLALMDRLRRAAEE